MTEPFLAEIRMFGGNFAPRGWALCNGQLMSISQNTALFSLLGVTYGGDGRVTFALPNLQGSGPMQQGQGNGLSPRDLGETGGTSTITLLQTEMPTHTHLVGTVDAPGDSNSPANNVLAQAAQGRVVDRLYGSGTSPNVMMNTSSYSATGGNQAHNNMPPYLVVTFMIALQGVFPQRP